MNQDPGISPDRKKGAAVHLAAMRAAFEELGAELVVVDAEDPAEVMRCLQAAHSHSPLDLVYERYALGAFAASHFAQQAGVPHVLEVNAPLADEAQRYRPESRVIVDADSERNVFRAARQVIAVSGAMADYAASKGAERAHVRVHPNGVDARRFRPHSERSSMRQALGLEDRFVIGFHGRLRPWHAFEDLVTVARERFDAGSDVHVLTIGEGPFEEILARHLPASRFTHLPWVAHEDIAQHVACFDVIAMTYQPDESFYFSPLKLLEAMACGVVPVVPRLGDLPKIVEHEYSGLTFPAGDHVELRTALQRLEQNPSKMGILSEAARRSALSHSWTSIAESILSEALGNPS